MCFWYYELNIITMAKASDKMIYILMAITILKNIWIFEIIFHFIENWDNNGFYVIYTLILLFAFIWAWGGIICILISHTSLNDWQYEAVSILCKLK